MFPEHFRARIEQGKTKQFIGAFLQALIFYWFLFTGAGTIVRYAFSILGFTWQRSIPELITTGFFTGLFFVLFWSIEMRRRYRSNHIVDNAPVMDEDVLR